MTFEGKAAVITGGASGIGRATALALARRGAKVVIADIDAVGGAETVEEAASSGGLIHFQRFDVARDGFETLRDAAIDRYGALDIVMNNVGALTNGEPDKIPEAEWRRIIDLNLMSVVRSNAVFAPYLAERGRGHIVNTSSFAGLFTYAFDRLPYAATKAALVQISEGLAIYLRPKGVHVALLCPGPVRTNISKSVPSFGPRADLRTPGPQFALLEPSAVADMVLEALEHRRFLIVTHEAVKDLLIARATDWDAFLDDQIAHPHVVKLD